MPSKTRGRGQTKGRTRGRGKTRGRGRTQRQQGGKPGYTITGAKIPAAPKRSISGAIIQSPVQKQYPVSPMQQNQSMQQMPYGQQPYSSRGKTRGRTQRRGQQRD